jgi:hypothetical protein
MMLLQLFATVIMIFAVAGALIWLLQSVIVAIQNNTRSNEPLIDIHLRENVSK